MLRRSSLQVYPMPDAMPGDPGRRGLPPGSVERCPIVHEIKLFRFLLCGTGAATNASPAPRAIGINPGSG